VLRLTDSASLDNKKAPEIRGLVAGNAWQTQAFQKLKTTHSIINYQPKPLNLLAISVAI
jgi:hypothetical protein